MVIALPLLAFPIYHLWPVYKWVTTPCPFTKKQILSTIPQSIINSINNSNTAFLKKTGIREDLVIWISDDKNFSAYGSNYLTSRPAFVFLDLSFFKKDNEAATWIIRHEIAHIKYSDTLVRSLLTALVALVTGIFMTFLLSFILSPLISSVAAALISGVCSFGFNISFSIYQEMRADAFANYNSSPAVLKGGLRFFRATQAAHVRLLQQNPQQASSISPSGENEDDFYHPFIESRIKEIESVLLQRKESSEIDPTAQKDLNEWMFKHM